MGGLGIRPFTRGLHDLGRGTFAFLQPSGSWGWSNAGLIVDGDQSLLVDTLFDMPLTAEMLAAMADATPAARTIGTLVNTHSNGDHCNGNALCPHAEILASAASLAAMAHETPEQMAALKAAAPGMGVVGAFFLHCFGAFDFAGVERRLPDVTFSGHLTRMVGDKRVELIEVGPAHTAGDVIVHVPRDRIVFTGDILFIEGHPIMWQGPVGNWIAACEAILALEPAEIVPGHGPITDKRGVIAVRDYLSYVRNEALRRFEAGLGPAEAARDIALGDYDSWGDGERIAVNVATLYREFTGDTSPPDMIGLFGLMAQLHHDRPGRRSQGGSSP